jgi:hypothetical protein
MAAMYYANGTYTLGDSVYQQLEVNPSFNLASCGHTSGSFSDLSYWANLPTIPTGCQGPAYGAMLTWMATAASLAPGAQRILIYNQVEHIENSLALYLWYEQVNGVATYSKWINPTTINTNVMIGGGGDQTFYLWSYATAVSNVYFNETGLTAGTSWSVTYAGATYSSTGTSITIPGQTAGTYAYSIGYTPEYTVGTASGSVVVAPPANNAITVAFSGYTCTIGTCGAATFAEGGLQSGTSWTVVVATLGSITTNASSSVFTDVLTSGSPYSYTIVPTVGYNTTTPTGGTGTFTVLTTGVTTQVFFTGVLFSTYAVTFASSGLAGGSWSVKLNGYNNTTTNPSITFWEANNTYPFAISTTTALTPIATVGQATINGANQVINVPFSASPQTLTFTAGGLEAGVAWGVTLLANGASGGGFTVPSTTSTVVFNVGNGVWNFSAMPLAGWSTPNETGQVTVSGAATGFTIPYTLVTYAVTIYEVGLPSGDSWTVSATYTFPGTATTNVTSATSAGNTANVNLPNGTATFVVAAPVGWTCSGGSITVAAQIGFGVTVCTGNVTTYAVTFTQSGVPTGSNWNVTVNGVGQQTTGASLVFNLPNGTYTYVVTVPTGYTASPAGGSGVVSGSVSTVSVTVAQTTTPVGPAPAASGLSTLAYELIGLFVVLAVIFLITTLYFASRKPPAATPPASWQSSTTTTESKDETSTPPPS